MTTYVPTLDQRELNGLVDDIRQMTSPWRLATVVEHVWWDRNRNRKIRFETVVQRQDPLLDQLRDAAAGGLPQHVGARPERRGKPATKPPPGWSEDASSRLAELYVGLSGWHARLGPRALPYEDWQKAALRVLAGSAVRLDRVVAEELAGDVRRWWTWCVTQSGLSPADLLDQRSGS